MSGAGMPSILKHEVVRPLGYIPTSLAHLQLITPSLFSLLVSNTFVARRAKHLAKQFPHVFVKASQKSKPCRWVWTLLPLSPPAGTEAGSVKIVNCGMR